MAAENTGYKAYATLVKVTGDGTNRPLDINGELCSISGLPQEAKSNTATDSDYFAPVYDTTTCPIGPSGPPYVSLLVYDTNQESVGNACIIAGGSRTLYTNALPPVAGTTIMYSDSGLTTPFNGTNFWFKSVTNNYSIQIGVGTVVNKVSC